MQLQYIAKRWITLVSCTQKVHQFFRKFNIWSRKPPVVKAKQNIVHFGTFEWEIQNSLHTGEIHDHWWEPNIVQREPGYVQFMPLKRAMSGILSSFVIPKPNMHCLQSYKQGKAQIRYGLQGPISVDSKCEYSNSFSTKVTAWKLTTYTPLQNW